MHARVFAAATKYDVLALQKLAASKFAEAAQSSWDHPSFADAARIAYTTTPDSVRDLRNIVGATLNSHVNLLN